MMNEDFIRRCRDAIENRAWDGPDTVYLLCFPEREEDAEFIARVVPELGWSFQRWQTADVIQFTQLKTKHRWYDVREIDKTETDLHLAFGSLPVYDVNACQMMGGD